MQVLPAITATNDGGFLVSWTSTMAGLNGSDIFARRFDASGTALGGAFRVSAGANSDQANDDSDITATEHGFVFAWDAEEDLEEHAYQRVYVETGGLTTFTDLIWGLTNGNDMIYSLSGGLSTGDVIDGLGGTDTIRLAEAGVLDGRKGTLTGIERFSGSSGNDTVIGTAGSEVIDGGAGIDVLIGGAGNDAYLVNTMRDRIVEASGGGSDRVKATSSFSLAAFSQVEHVTLLGTAGTTAIGNSLRNVLVGNSGANTIDGKLGADLLTGGAGADKFVFTTALSSSNIDRITDFVTGVDRIHLDNAVMSKLGATGRFDGHDFVLGTKALDSADRLIYDKAAGKLYYDADGSGAGAKVQILSFEANTKLAASDIFVV